MSKISIKFASLCMFICAYAAYTPTALAELGGAVSKEAVLVQEQSSVVATEQRLNVYQIKVTSGTRIKEYVDANNVVVAVSWQGPTLPNLKQLLGSYFDTFANRPVGHASSHRNAELITDDLVVQSQGQMRHFAGRAYLPRLLPAGFNTDQIQ